MLKEELSQLKENMSGNVIKDNTSGNVIKANMSGNSEKFLKRHNMKLELDIDAQEQYERRDSVVVHNVRERGPGENLHHLAVLLCAATGGTISPLEVSVAHRLGRASNRPRPIIIKFTRRCVKTLLMRNKIKLRHTPGWQNVYGDISQIRTFAFF